MGTGNRVETQEWEGEVGEENKREGCKGVKGGTVRCSDYSVLINFWCNEAQIDCT